MNPASDIIEARYGDHDMKRKFGMVDGASVYLYTIANEKIEMSVTDYGACLVRFVDLESGKDIVLGFDDVSGYVDQTSYIGASIGRTANRIAKGRFTLNGAVYTLPINNNGNCNHGGIKGFDKVIWKTEEYADRVVFTYVSKDGEEGYPGELHVKVTYRLLENGIEIQAEGTPDQDTLFAYTNHSYFDLSGNGNAMDQEVKIFSDWYMHSDADGLAVDESEDVSGTPFDFTSFHKPSERIMEEDEQLAFGHGYDHYYPIEGSGMRQFAVCQYGDLVMEVYADQPGMHFYSANWLENKTGKDGRKYPPRSALCFECAYMPNAVNYDDVKEKPIVRAGKTSVQTMRYVLHHH